MKHTFCYLLLLILTTCQTQLDKENEVTNQEEWMSLFNGNDLTAWDIKVAGFDVNDNYKETFVVEDSMIRIQYDEYETFEEAYGHLYYETPYSYYKLAFDYHFVGEQIAGGAEWNVRNSGVMLHSQSAASNEMGQHFPVSVELQLLGGLGEGERTTGNVCTPGTAVVMSRHDQLRTLHQF